MPNLQDVAKLAGVSIATVSKVISNTPYVAEATRQKVMSAIHEIGYRPNLAARALSSGKTHIIAVAFPYVFDALFKDPLVLAILEGIESVLNKHSYNLLLSTPRLQAGGVDESYLNLLESGYVDGLIAIDSVPIASAAHFAQERQIPTVVIGYHESPYSVRCDDRQGGALMLQHVLDLGHQHIGIITVPSTMNFAVNERIEGIRQLAHQRGLDFDSFPCVDSDFSMQGGGIAAEQLLRQYPHLTAILCINDRMALGAIQQLQQFGVRVPQDVSIMGYDNLTMSEVANPPLTTVNQHATLLGQSAAEILFEVLENQTSSPRILPAALIERQSTAHPRQAPLVQLTGKE